MAIGRTEERDTARDSVMLRHRESVCDPIRVTHLGQRSIRPHSKAGHMTAIDQTCPRCKKTLRGGGRPHMSQSPYSTPIHSQGTRRASIRLRNGGSFHLTGVPGGSPGLLEYMNSMASPG
jgi:hypothetical protein